MPDQIKDPVREAFAKAKQDVLNLSSEIEFLKREINLLKNIIKSSSNQTDRPTDNSTKIPTENNESPAQNPRNQTFQHINTIEKITPAHNLPYKAPKSQISIISTGSKGVPADRQTDQQTDNKQGNTKLNESLHNQFQQQTNHQSTQRYTEKVSQILESLDSIKKDLRLKFKRLTPQEMTVFSTIYQLEEEGLIVDYPSISKKLSLTESSIRDYTQRILKKGIPIIKTKENNKKILLSISKDLKKLATLSTIIQLRGL